MTKYQEGDEVTVRGVLSPDGEGLIEQNGFVNVKFEDIQATFYVATSSIATHAPKPRELKPGDRVIWPGRGSPCLWELVAIREVHGESFGIIFRQEIAVSVALGNLALA